MNDTPRQVEPEFTHYRRSQIAHLRPYVSGETLSDRVSISAADLEAGSPKPGDMIARNPANHDDQWLVAADYFAANFEPVSAAPAPEGGAVDIDDMRVRARYLRDYAPLVSAAMYGGEKPSGIWNLNRAADLLDLAATALATREEAPALENPDEPSAPENARDWPSEEAPAEAGDFGDALLAFLYRHGLKVALDVSEIEALRQSALRAQPPAREDAQPVARVSRKGNATGGLVWTDHGRASDLPDGAALFAAHLIEGRGEMKQEIYDNLCAADDQDIPLEDYPDRILSVVERYTHPAPDALRVAVEAFDVITDLSVNLRQGGPDSSDLNDLSDALNTAVDVAHEALAALQAEQKGGA